MPDRFSNGDPSNDQIAGLKDQSLNRDSIFLRHGGDLKGVTNHLDYFQKLGVSTLWMTPVIENDMITKHHVHIDQALKTPQFYLLWLVLCLNVTAGIGVLGQASVMIQEIFKGTITAAAAAGFVGLLSLFNMGGRFFWSSASDFIGRKNIVFLPSTQHKT